MDFYEKSQKCNWAFENTVLMLEMNENCSSETANVNNKKEKMRINYLKFCFQAR